MKQRVDTSYGKCESMACIPLQLGGGWGSYIFRKVSAREGGGAEIFILVGGCIVGGVILFGGVTEF